MSSLASHIATVVCTLVSAYFLRFIEPKIKIVYWVSHSFLYTIPADQLGPPPAQAQPALPPLQQQQMPLPQVARPPFLLFTQSITVQNLGRKTADWVEVVHLRRPDYFQLHPPLNYTEATTPAGEHVLRVEAIGPKQVFTIQFLCYLNRLDFAYIRSAAGHATAIPWMTVRQYPRWVYSGMRILMLIGGGYCAYWLIRGSVFVLKAVGAF